MNCDFGYFGGIDFSGAREPLSNLWSAVGVIENDNLRIVDLRPHAFRADAAAFLAEGWVKAVGANGDSILWGVDFPFSLPEKVATGVGEKSWAGIAAWVADRPPDEVREAAGDETRTARMCDSGGAMAPLDLRIYKQTVQGMRWLHELVDEADVAVLPQRPADKSTASLIEVYPSATVRDLGLPRRRSPGRPGEARARAASLKPYLEFADPLVEALAVTLEDAWDATIACLTAFQCRADLDQPFRLMPDSRKQIELEGWIYRVPTALD